MTVASVVTALNNIDISSNDVATVSAIQISSSVWKVTGQSQWQGTQSSAWAFKGGNSTAGTLNASSVSSTGVQTSLGAMTVLAYNGTTALLGAGQATKGIYSTYYLVSDSSLKSAPSYPVTLPSSGPYTAPSSVTPPCFVAGTRIRTQRGDVAVEALAVGDQVAVLDAPGFRPVVWIGRREVTPASHPNPELVRPIRITREAIGPGAPSRDLLVSADHAIYVDRSIDADPPGRPDGMLVPARMLVNGASIVPEPVSRPVTYYHVELDAHAVLFADGVASESYLDTGNRASFAAANGTTLLHPAFDARQDVRAAGSCVPFVTAPEAVEPVWARLAARAEALGWSRPQPGVTTDPALRVRIGEREIRPTLSEPDRAIFTLPHDAGEIRLLSRASTPAELRPWLDDRRTLGVCVARLLVRDATLLTDIALDHPALARGWWDRELRGTSAWRWTDGDATIVLPPGSGQARILEIRLAASGTYLAEAPATSLAAYDGQAA